MQDLSNNQPETSQINRYFHAHLQNTHRNCMDLTGRLPETSFGNKFTLTAICLLTNYVFMVPIPDKSTQQVIHAYQKHIYAQFGGSRYILTDRGSEFTSEMMHQLASE